MSLIGDQCHSREDGDVFFASFFFAAGQHNRCKVLVMVSEPSHINAAQKIRCKLFAVASECGDRETILCSALVPCRESIFFAVLPLCDDICNLLLRPVRIRMLMKLIDGGKLRISLACLCKGGSLCLKVFLKQQGGDVKPKKYAC